MQRPLNPSHDERNTMTSRYLIRASEVEAYSPANHTGTINRRLVSQANVGAQHMEVVLGEIAKGGGALPHAHPGMEQACYLLEGTAHVEVEGESFEMVPGDTCFFRPTRCISSRPPATRLPSCW